MSEYKNHATGRITDAFDRMELKYHVVDQDEQEIIMVNINLPGLPTFYLHFLPAGDQNDVEARIPCIVNDIPTDQRDAFLAMRNTWALQYSYCKFVMDDDGDLSMVCDFPPLLRDASVGKVAIEIYSRFCSTLMAVFPQIMRALVQDE